MSNDPSTPVHLPEQQEQTGHSADSKLNRSPHGAESRSSQQLDVLIVDAGSGDASVAMSCPPAAFLEPEFLQHARQVLKGGGMLVVNCVSRAVEPYKAAVKALQVGCLYTHFRRLYYQFNIIINHVSSLNSAANYCLLNTA